MKTHIQNIILFLIPIISLSVWNGNATSIEIKLPLVQILVSILSIYILIKVVKQKTIKFNYGSLNIFVLLFLFVSLFSYLSTHRMSFNYVTAMPQIYGMILFFLILSIFKKSDLKSLLEVITYTSIPASIYGIIQFLNLDPVDWVIVNERLRVVSFFGHKNYFAIYLLLIIPINIYLSILEVDKVKNIIFKLSAILAFLALMLSYSRGAFVSFVIFSFISSILYLNRNQVKKVSYKPYTYFIPVLFLIILPFIIPESIKKDIANIYKKKELNTRIVFWKGATEVISRNPITGVGPGNFRNEYPKNIKNKIHSGAPNRVVNHVHNDFLEIYSEYGFLGIVFYLIIIITVLYRLWIGFHCKDYTKKDYLLLLALFTSICSFVAYSVVTVAPRFMSSQFYFWLLIAIVEIVLQEDDKTKFIEVKSIKLRIGLLIFCLSLISFSFLVSISRYTSSHLVQKSQNHIKRKIGNASEAIEYLDKAIKLDSKNIDALYAKGYASFMVGKIAEAKEYYLNISKIYPAYVNVAFNIASCYYREGNWLESLSYAKESFRQYPNYTPNGIMLGYCYYYLRDIDESKYFCEMILAREPENKKALALKKGLDAIKVGGSL